METLNISLLSVLAIGFAFPSALLGLPGGQSSIQPGAPAPNDQTYHRADGMTGSRESQST